MFFDFSNALNTIQSQLLGEKLKRMQVASELIFIKVGKLSKKQFCKTTVPVAQKLFLTLTPLKQGWSGIWGNCGNPRWAAG